MAKTLERRRGHRHAAYLPAEILVDRQTTRSAITKDISDHGLLLLTRARLQESQTVVLRVHVFKPEEHTVVVHAKVVRREPLNEEEKGTWREKVAVCFDTVQPELAEDFGLCSVESERPQLYDWDS